MTTQGHDSEQLSRRPLILDGSLRRWHVLVVLLIALLFRGGALVLWYKNLEADPDAYRDFAETLVETGVYGQRATPDRTGHHDNWRYFYIAYSGPSAYRSPLYPLVLTHCVTSRFDTQLAIALTHLALGLATVALTLLVGRQLGLGRWSAVAALLVAADPILLHHSTLVMTETLATFLAVLDLYSLNRFSVRPCLWNAGLAGGALALSALCRPVFFVTMALVGGYLMLGRLARLPLLLRDLKSWRSRGLRFASFSVIALAVLSPWVIRNWIAFGKPIFATTHGGYTLELANNSSFYSYLRYGKSGTTWDGLGRPHVLPDGTIDESYGIYTQDLQMPFSSGPFDSQPEAAGVISDRSNYESAFQAIRDQPGMFAYACLVRIGRLWQLVPHRLDEDEGASRRWMRYAVGVWYALVFALALAGCWSLWRERRKRANASAQESDEARSGANNSSPRGQWVWGFLMIASFMLVHTFYWTNMRMRAPLMPYIALLAAAGLSFLLARRSRQTA